MTESAMTTTIFPIASPPLTAGEQTGLHDFFQVYDAHYDQIMLSMGGDSNIEMTGRRAPPEQAAVQQRQARALLQRAILDGDWTPYVSYLQEQGVRYAQDGQSFQNFFGRLGAFRGGTLPYLVEAYAQAPDRLASALYGMNTLADMVMGVVGQGFLETKETLIRAQEDEFRDITTRQRAEDKFNGLLESAPDAMIIVNVDGNIVQVNSQTKTMFGYSRQDLVGQPVDMLLAERFRGQHVVEPKVRRMGGGPELFALQRDGSEFPVEISLSPIETEDGILVTAAIRPITDQMTAEARFRGVLELAPDAIVIVDQAGQIVLVNAQMERLFGYARDEILGASIDKLVPQWFRDWHPATRADFVGETQLRPMGTGLDLYGVRKDGGEFPVEISLNPLETEDGLRVTAAIRDATERKRFEESLLREKNLELEAAILAKDRFLAGMSHELRTPLNAIIGFTGTLLMRLPGPLTPDQEKQLRTVQTSARHLLSLINDLLDLAKIESGKVELNLELVAAQAVLDEVISSLAPAAAAKQLRLEGSPPQPNLVVRADRRALSQILLNLANNAIKFTDIGEVRLALSQRQAHNGTITEISVADTGIGIRPEDQARLFQAFEQVSSAEMRRREGTGLGLYLSQKLAGLLGGRIEFESEYGHGSLFRLVIEEG